MPDGLQKQFGLNAPAQAGSDQQSKEFQALFAREIKAINDHLQYTATHADKALHGPWAGKRDALVASFQGALAQIDPQNASKAQGAIDRVLESARTLGAEVAKFRETAEKDWDTWQDDKKSFDEAVTQIEELEAWEHAEAANFRSTATTIQKHDNARQCAEASKANAALGPKLAPVHEEYLKQKAAKEKYEPAIDKLEPELTKAMAKGFAKLEPQQQAITTQKTEMEAAATAKDFVKALEVFVQLETKVADYNEANEELEKQKQEYEAALADAQTDLAAATTSSFRKLEPMQNDLRTTQEQMEAAAKEDDYTKALAGVKDLASKAKTIADEKQKLDEQKKAYDAALEPLQPRLSKAAEATDEKMKPAQSEIAAKKMEMESAAEAEDFERGVQLCGELEKKLDDFEKGIPGDGVKVIVPIEKSFKLASPLKAKGAYCTFSAELSIKLKGSLELQSKGKMGTSTDIAPLGYSDGLVMRMGETWYSKDGAQICGMQTTIVETKLVGEAKVKDGIEFSFAGSVKFANGEELKLKFVVAKVDEKDGVSGPGAELSYVFKAISGKIELEGATFSGGIQLQVAGKAQPDYEAIGKLVAEKVLERGAQILASVTAAEALIAAGAVGISIAVLYTAFSGMARGSEIRGLYPLSEKATNQMVDAYIAGFSGAGSPGGQAGAGHTMGVTAFNNLKARIAAKVPDVTDAEIREKADVASKRPFIWGEVNPRAKQAVWQAFAEANRGDKSMLRNGHVNLFGRLPADGDSNYTRYLEDEEEAEAV